MYRFFGLCAWVIIGVALSSLSSVHAELKFNVIEGDPGERMIVVSGTFAHEQGLDEFAALLRQHDPIFVIFDSPGGNAVKAMELGAIIRRHGVDTVQLRRLGAVGLECSSACALAFMGGVNRIAAPGSIGVHRSSFTDASAVSSEEAVAAIQHMTAAIMSYMSQMGVDPAMLRLALAYDSADMRYLSHSEMEEYRVISVGEPQSAGRAPADAPPPLIRLPSASPSAEGQAAKMPEAQSGHVRHPGGVIALKSEPDTSSPDLAMIANGTPVSILKDQDRWYALEIAERDLRGYMHHTWVAVDQYVGGIGESRYIQVGSFSALNNAEQFVATSRMPLSVYQARNGWYAITLVDTFEEEVASRLIDSLKAQGAIASDSFITYGNTYVRKLCCD